MIARSSSARKPIDSTRSRPSPRCYAEAGDRSFERDHLALAGLDTAVHPEEPRHREPPDVGVEDADGEAPPGQRHGQVDRDRRLADAALAGRDRQDPGRRRHRRRRCVLPGLPAGAAHDVRLLGRVHLSDGQLDRGDAGEPGQPAADVPLDLAAQRAAGDRQRHLDVDGPVRVDLETADHAEVDDVRAQLRVDHCPQGVAGLIRRGRRWPGSVAPGLALGVAWQRLGRHERNSTGMTPVADRVAPGRSAEAPARR